MPVTEEPLSLLPERLGLPRGRAALPESEVAASQRGRIMQAVTDEVAEVGYARATISGITRRARVSRTTFYQSFSDKEDAFAQAYVAVSDRIVGRIRERAAETDASAWQDRIELGARALIESLETTPSYARSYMVEVHGAGERLLGLRDRVVERHSRSLASVARLAEAAGATVRRPSDLEVIGAIGATEELVGRAVRRSDESTDLTAELEAVVEPIVTIHTAVLRPQ